MSAAPSDPRDNLIDNVPMVGEAGSTVAPGSVENDPTLYGHVHIEGL